jgi:hypothetical protein
MSIIGSNFWFCVSNVHPMIIIEIQFGGDGNHLRFQIGNKEQCQGVLFINIYTYIFDMFACMIYYN